MEEGKEVVRIKAFLRNQSERYINEWLEENVSPEDLIDVKTASVVGNGKIFDRIYVVYKTRKKEEDLPEDRSEEFAEY